jgi:CubicO group peptidase (beta-lactamase class C family)
VLGVGAALAAAALTGCADPRPEAAADPAPISPGPAPPGGDPPATPTPTPGPTTRPAEPTVVATGSAPYVDDLAAELRRWLKPTRANPAHPTYAGAVALVLVGGEVAAHVAVGHALRYGAGPVSLPAASRVPMRPDSVFDLASLTKVYTSILLLRQVERGRVELDAPVADYLPAFGRPAVTVRMLLTHTSGLPVGPKIAGLTTVAARRRAVLTTPLVKGAVPGSTFRYSSTGLLVAQQLVEQATGSPLDAALRAGITGPLGLRDTGFRPLTWLSAAARRNRLVATDARSSRGVLRGQVHDQVTHALGGVAGSAGIFATAKDVAAIGSLLLGGGAYRGTRMLSAATTAEMLRNHNAGRPAIDPDRPGRPSDHGLGVTLRQPWFMGRLAGAATFGHTGFTGTSLLVEPRRRLVLALLTNRAHPNWSWADPDPMRAAVATLLARAIP